jgi:hypothetical protein
MTYSPACTGCSPCCGCTSCTRSTRGNASTSLNFPRHPVWPILQSVLRADFPAESAHASISPCTGAPQGAHASMRRRG